jgi:hypothetical protein
MLILLLAFISGFAMDIVWTVCVDAVTQRQPLKAANFSAAMYICTIISTVLIVEKCFIAVAAYIVGGWLGTYMIVRRRQV